MEATKDKSTNLAGGSLLRYPLRSATRTKDPQGMRVRTVSNVALSMSALDISDKEKSAELSRRKANHTKPIDNPSATPTRSMTPIYENRKSRLNTPLNSDTPLSDSSRSSIRRKFCVLSSVSYWLTQIKLSEAASKHSVSLGFFRLALESGVEPLLRIREELKSYVLRHNLVEELGDFTKEILNIYNISEDLQKLQISQSGYQLQEDGSQKSEISNHSETAGRARSLKSKFLSTNTLSESNKKESIQSKTPAIKQKPATDDSVGDSAVENSQKTGKRLAKSAKNETMNSAKSSTSNEVDDSHHDEEKRLDDKENMVAENLVLDGSNELQAN